MAASKVSLFCAPHKGNYLWIERGGGGHFPGANHIFFPVYHLYLFFYLYLFFFSFPIITIFLNVYQINPEKCYRDELSN